MPMTLLEASKYTSGDVVRSTIIEMYARESDIMRVAPFIDVPGGAYVYNQEAELPGVGFRAINQAYPESVGVINPAVEALRIAGGDLDTDRALIRMHGVGMRSQSEMMKVKALSLYLTKQFLKGDSSVDPLSFDGLQTRISGNQLIENSSSTGAALSLNKLDEAIDAVDGPTHIIMSKAMRRRLTGATRLVGAVGGNIEYSRDEFGRQIASYDGLPILIADHDEKGARILQFNEAASGGGTTSTSVYVVSFGPDKLSMLQNGIMEVTDLGQIDSKPVERTRIDWLVGMAAMHGRCAARVRGITDAAVTA